MDRGLFRDDSSIEQEPDRCRTLQDRRLRAIGDLLGRDVETFEADGQPSRYIERLSETNELIRLWLSIPNEDGRKKLLALVRSFA